MALDLPEAVAEYLAAEEAKAEPEKKRVFLGMF